MPGFNHFTCEHGPEVVRVGSEYDSMGADAEILGYQSHITKATAIS
ncbi:unnamed protein product [Haemonchus placei]|uniref:Uncharacterized protein n=1 Tax=Haemonchus placei TaxID=6290 RepID=A0A3P7YWR9_HAEPC|nr:unnamed protein product [Haemonchus placei]